MESTRPQRTYVQIRKNLFARRAMAGEDPRKMVVIEDKSGYKNDYILFNTLEGYIKQIFLTRTNSGHDILNVDIHTEDDSRTLQVPMYFYVATQFLQRMENIDYQLLVRINISEKEGKNFIWIEQLNEKQKLEKVPVSYTKDNPEGRPKWKKDSEGNWDRSEEMQWWKQKIAEMKSNIDLLFPLDV